MVMVEEICKHCKHCLSCFCGDEFKDCKLKKSPSERALDFGKMLRSHGESEDSYTSGAAGYEKGATEQKAIDEDHLREVKQMVVDKACNVFCHTGCPHKTDSFDCLNNKCDTWKIFNVTLGKSLKK